MPGSLGTGSGGALFEPPEHFRSVEAIFSAEPMGWQPVASDELGYGPHVHVEHLGDLLRGKDISFGTLVSCKFFTHRRPYQVTNLFRGHDEYCIHGPYLVIERQDCQRRRSEKSTALVRFLPQKLDEF